MSADIMRRTILGASGKERHSAVGAPRNTEGSLSQLLAFTHNVGSTCDLGIQTVALTPGASSTCGSGACTCTSSCCW